MMALTPLCNLWGLDFTELLGTVSSASSRVEHNFFVCEKKKPTDFPNQADLWS